ncbi:MAG: YggU family protein [Deltaproteobacteria bacterium]|nr:YggU family protein [Deltaproteobacteria bacterium]
MKNRKSSSSSQSKFPFLEITPKGNFIRLRLQPRSSRNLIDGVQGDALKVRLTAPPVEGEANKALIEFLSDVLGVKKSALSLEAGHKSRDKRVKVDGMTPEDIEKAFSKDLG